MSIRDTILERETERSGGQEPLAVQPPEHAARRTAKSPLPLDIHPDESGGRGDPGKRRSEALLRYFVSDIARSPKGVDDNRSTSSMFGIQPTSVTPGEGDFYGTPWPNRR